MPRKAKGQELNQEQLIEMQALFEGSDYGGVKIAETINERHNVKITEGTVRHYAKKEGWVKGKKKEYYNAKKVAKVTETLAKAKDEDREYKLITKISKQAEKEGEKVALLTLKSESFKMEIEAEYAKGILLSIKNHNTVQELIQSGKVTDTEFEYVGTIAGKTGKVLRKTRALLPKDLGYDQIKIGQAFGFAQFPQQQNNTQINIGGEVVEKETERQLEKVKNRADFQDFVGKLQK